MTLKGPILALVCAALLARSSAAQAPATASAPVKEPPQVTAARKAVAEAVAVLAKDLASDDAATRQAAQKMLAELSESVITDMLDQTSLDDPDLATRSRWLLGSIKRSAALGEMLLSLPKDERKDMAAAATSRPTVFNRLASEQSAQVAAAATDLLSDPQLQVPLLRWVLQQPDYSLRQSVLANCIGRKLQTKTLDLLAAHADRLSTRIDSAMFPAELIRTGNAQEFARQESVKVLGLLADAKDERALAYLLAKFDTEPYYLREQYLSLFVAIDSKKTIVTLMDYIDRQQNITSYGFNNKMIYLNQGDLAMLIILLQTKQEPSDYGFTNPGSPQYTGFENEEQRTKAKEKVRKWFDEHAKEYEDVPKIGRPAGTGGKDLPTFLQRAADMAQAEARKSAEAKVPDSSRPATRPSTQPKAGANR